MSKRQFKITDESNRYSDAFVVRERQHTSYGNVWPCVAVARTKYDAEAIALRMGELLTEEFES